MAIEYTVVSLSQRPDLAGEMNRIGREGWPEFMLHDPVALEHWTEMVEAFGECQLMLIRGDDVLAIVNTAPLRFAGGLGELPDEGVEWGIRKALSDHRDAAAPNLLMGVQVVIDEPYLGQGLSAATVREMLALARDKGFRSLIVPLRPSNKHEYPLIDMDDYLHWKNDEGWPFDNWLRAHVKAGGDVLGVCAKSMYIPGTVREWEQWTGQKFPGSGRYVVRGALKPVEIDLENDIGTYTEPNVWIVHVPDKA